MSARRAVFLDRDGVLNRVFIRNGKRVPPRSVADLHLLDRVPVACDALHKAGFLLVVVTNQPDVSRGTQRRQVVEAINAALNRRLPLDDVRVCYHDDGDKCGCRKPEPGMLTAAADAWGIDLKASFMVGDQPRDVEAGRRAGCRTFLVEPAALGSVRCAPTERVRSLADAAACILLAERTSAGAAR